MKLRRVVVTGLGAVSPIGNDVPTMWENAKNGVSGAGPITHFDAYLFKTQFACEVKDFDPTATIDRREIRKVDADTHYGVAAAVEAINDSGLDSPHEKSLTFNFPCHELFHGKVKSETSSDIVR